MISILLLDSHFIKQNDCILRQQRINIFRPNCVVLLVCKEMMVKQCIYNANWNNHRDLSYHISIQSQLSVVAVSVNTLNSPVCSII